VIIICCALIADAAIGNYQEKIMKEHHVPNVEIVFYSFIFGFGFVLLGLLITDNFFSSLQFWNKVRRIYLHKTQQIFILIFSILYQLMVMV
jgi:adenosine 3'-phospho 5'-phosphosulfate transporter B3